MTSHGAQAMAGRAIPASRAAPDRAGAHTAVAIQRLVPLVLPASSNDPATATAARHTTAPPACGRGRAAAGGPVIAAAPPVPAAPLPPG
jgi:hypothetical protein